MFTKEWQGLEESCSCIEKHINSSPSDHGLSTPLDYIKHISINQKCASDCQKLDKVAAITQHYLGSKLICGDIQGTYNY